jgi:hypothetical protein
MGWLIWWLLLWGLIGAWHGQRRWRSTSGFFVCVLLGPLGVLAVLLSRSNQEMVIKDMRRQGNRQCPWCAEWIKQEAQVCKHCGRAVYESPAVS